MSFSSKVKEELSRQLSPARHCQIAEIAAILSLCGRIQISENNRYRVKIHTENEAVARKYFTLLKKTFNIRIDVSIRQGIGNHKNRTCTVAVTHHEGPSCTTGVFHTASCEAVRLCGISSRFQLLSPSTRQVTHALLTRPPLTYISLGFNVSPFDLHVLGTPPAFILSQDQTLMLKWCLCPASFIWHCLLLIRVACQSFDQLACS